MKPKHRLLLLCGLILCLVLICSGCSQKGDSSFHGAEGKKNGTRPNAPHVYVPEASGTALIGSSPLTLDISHIDQGYLMALYDGSAAKAVVQITGPDGITYKYFISAQDQHVTLPLTAGSGSYTVAGYENIVDNQYASLYKESIEVSLSNELLPFLYPNQYISFTRDTQAVVKASEVVKGASSDLDAVGEVYHFVIEHVTYDDKKAKTVPSGYLPDVDETLATGKGICFDYAALTTAMLRSQNIPTRLEIGYSGKIYHAWISVYIEDIGWIDNLIEFTGDGWTRMDPTFASSNDNSENILKYIGDGSNYTMQYLH